MFIDNSSHIFNNRVQTLHDVQKKDLETLKTCQKLHQTQWEGREAEYKKMVKHLERKVLIC